MSYDIEKIHQPKNWDRRQGRTVDAVADAIGKLMVTENEIIPFVAMYLERSRHVTTEFEKMVREHYGEVPVRYKQLEIGIVGYSSRIVFYQLDRWEDHDHFGRNIEPTYDLD